ncbi:MAG: GSCFA domain-containing protein [Tannerellaceae bacterium]
MDFRTQIIIPHMPFDFSYDDKVMVMGSCFADNIGNRLIDSKFRVDANPFGTLYNPASIASSLRLLMEPKPFTEDDLFLHNGLYHSFSHHGRFSSVSAETTLQMINSQLAASADSLRKASRLIVTLGTAYTYRSKETDQVVANCHKLPDKAFTRERLTVQQIVWDWKECLRNLHALNPDLCVLFTVSPIRHWKDGAHANQLSKATLLLAVEAIQQVCPEQIAYFPAYELMMDELRDYRFYADDMLHPSPLAVEYIWQQFAASLFSPDTQRALREWIEIQKAINHKPFNPSSEGYRQFILQTLLKIERLNEKIRSFDLREEIETLKSKLN